MGFLLSICTKEMYGITDRPFHDESHHRITDRAECWNYRMILHRNFCGHH